jgi:hypothetical protein
MSMKWNDQKKIKAVIERTVQLMMNLGHYQYQRNV